MAIVIEGSVDSGPVGNVTDFVMDVPTGVADNEYLVAMFGKHDDDEPTAPSGWTKIAFIGTEDSTDFALGAYYKKVTDAASEPSTYTWVNPTGQTFYGTMFRISGVDQSTPLDATPVTSTEGNTSTPDSPSLTTTINNSLVFFLTGNNARIVDITSAPSGTTEQSDAHGADSGAGRSSCASATLVQATAGATGAKQWTLNASYFSVGMTFALREGGSAHTETPADTPAVTDSVAMEVDKNVAETPTVTDDVQTQSGFTSTPAETPTVTDNVGKAIVKNIADTPTIGDSTNAQIILALNVGDGVSTADDDSKVVGKVLAETPVVTDNLLSATGLGVTAMDGVSVADSSNQAINQVTLKYGKGIRMRTRARYNRLRNRI